MTLITRKIVKSAEKCKKCSFIKLKDKEFDKRNLLSPFYKKGLDKLVKVGCNICPQEKYFMIIYGMKPINYFQVK